MPELHRAAFFAYALWLFHNVHEWLAGMSAHLRLHGFLGVYLDHVVAYEWTLALMQLGALGALLLSERLPERLARWVLGLTLGLVFVGVIDHLLNGLPGWQSALALGSFSLLHWVWAWLRAGQGALALGLTVLLSGLAYLPFAALHIAPALALDALGLPPQLAWVAWGVNWALGIGAALTRLRKLPSGALWDTGEACR